MAGRKKIVGGTLAVLAAGYMIGLLTAPRSGKKTRKRFKSAADNSVADVEKQLKALYKQSQEQLARFSKDNPKLTTKLKQAKIKADASQDKIKELLSALHGNDAVDEDLSTAIKDAKAAIKHLGQYVRKS